MEEPPPHVLFIFATTEPEKLIVTIRSRTHHYPFRLVPPGILISHLEKVCNAEGIAVEKGVLPLVVRASGGSVRDALSVLGQLLAGAGKDGVTYEIAVQLLGFTDGALLDDAVDAIAARDASTLFMTVDRLIEAGHDPRRFAQDLLERIRDLIVVDALEGEASNVLRECSGDQLERMGSQSKRIGQASLSRAAEIISEGLLQMRGTTPPRLILELICGRISVPTVDSSHEGLLARVERLERVDGISNTKTTVPVQENKVEMPTVIQPIKEKKTDAQVRSTPKSSDLSSLRRMWPEVIENVKKRRRLTWSLLSASAQIIDSDDSTITIGIVNSGARDSFVRSESDAILAAAFQDVVGIERKIEVIVDSSINPNSSAAKTLRVDEDPSDENQLTGKDLLMKELGARVISESE